MNKSKIFIFYLLFSGLPVFAATAFTYWDPQDTTTVPKTLSLMGLYSSITPSKNTFLPSVNHFDVNSPLWSDGAHKNRWFILKPNTSIGFKLMDDYYDYPDSAVFIKQFDIDTIAGEPSSRVRWETRILFNKKDIVDTDAVTKKVNKEDHWYGYSYKWDADQKDAKLIGVKERKDSIRTFPNGKNQAAVMKKWLFPSRNQCNQCHRVMRDNPNDLHGRSVLGFFTAQLNMPHPDSAKVNQLEYFFSKGILTGDKPANWGSTDVPRWRGIEDNTASVELRARAYIAANCSGCHGARGTATSATSLLLDYDFHDMKPKMEFRQKGVQSGYGSDTAEPQFYKKMDLIANPSGLDSLQIQPALVVPGYPSKSVILVRQKARNAKPGDYYVGSYAMPPLATYEVNNPAMQVIAEWITTLTPVPAPNCCPQAGIHIGHSETFIKLPSIQGRTLRLPQIMASQKNLKVTLVSLNGKTITLSSFAPGLYTLPQSLSRGVYIIKAGNQTFQRQLF